MRCVSDEKSSHLEKCTMLKAGGRHMISTYERERQTPSRCGFASRCNGARKRERKKRENLELRLEHEQCMMVGSCFRTFNEGQVAVSGQVWLIVPSVLYAASVNDMLHKVLLLLGCRLRLLLCQLRFPVLLVEMLLPVVGDNLVHVCVVSGGDVEGRTGLDGPVIYSQLPAIRKGELQNAQDRCEGERCWR